MAMLKSYTCSKCAGVLNFDSDQEFFECPFCGTAFDVLDFHGDEVMEQAGSLLKNESFDAAREKYKAILKYDPKNFEANLGVVLCDLKVTSADRLEFPDLLPEYDVVNVRKSILKAKRNTEKNGSLYFGKMYELVSVKEDVARLRKEESELSSEQIGRKVNDKLVTDFKNERLLNRSNTVPVILTWVAIAVMLLVMLGMNGKFDDEKSLLVPFLVPLAVVAVIIVCIVIVDKLHDRDFKPVDDITNSFSGRIKERFNRYDEEYRKLRTLYPATDRISKLRDQESAVSGKESASLKEPQIDYSNIDPSEIVICSKCAARLALNKDKRVYQCDHCGVAYGISLFFGIPMEKALNSLNTGFYDDANQRFSSILMVHPSDFEALLGRVLCEGGWTKISDIDLTDDVDVSSYKAVRRRLGEAKQHASVHNVPFFENVEKMVGYCEEYKRNMQKIKENELEVKAFDAGTAVMDVAFHGKDFSIEREQKRTKLLSEAYPYRVSNKKIEDDFRQLRNLIVESRGDSVLAK